MDAFAAWLVEEALSSLIGMAVGAVLTAIAASVVQKRRVSNLERTVGDLKEQVEALQRDDAPESQPDDATSSSIGEPGTTAARSDQDRQAPERRVANDDDRQWCPLTPAELMARIEDRTSVASERLLKPYMGTWLRLEGTVIQVISLMKGTSVMLRMEGGLPGACDFTDGELDDHLAALRLGDRFSALGTLSSVRAEIGVSIGECELA